MKKVLKGLTKRKFSIDISCYYYRREICRAQVKGVIGSASFVPGSAFTIGI